MMKWKMGKICKIFLKEFKSYWSLKSASYSPFTKSSWNMFWAFYENEREIKRIMSLYLAQLLVITKSATFIRLHPTYNWFLFLIICDYIRKPTLSNGVFRKVNSLFMKIKGDFLIVNKHFIESDIIHSRPIHFVIFQAVTDFTLIHSLFFAGKNWPRWFLISSFKGKVLPSETFYRDRNK